MLSNEKMVAGRFGRWAVARRKAAWIAARLAEGRTVYVTTHLKSTALKSKHADMVRATKGGLYMQRGKLWDNIDYVKITAA